MTFLVNFNLPFKIALVDSSLDIKKDDLDFNILWFKRNGIISKHRNVVFSSNSSQWVKENISDKVIIEGGSQDKYWIGGVRKSDGKSIPAAYIDESIHGESTFQIQYTEIISYVQCKKEPMPIDWIISQVFEIVNNLIYCYKIITSDIDVHSVTVDDLDYIDVFEVTNGKFDIYRQKTNSGKVILQKLGLKLNWEKFKISRAFLSDYGEKLLIEIKEKVLKNYQAPLWFEIMLDAKNQSHVSKNYDLSIVLLETSFEVFIDYYLKEMLMARNESKIDITNKLKDSFSNKLKQQFPGLIKKEIHEGIKEYDDWNNYLYKLRNEIVHNGAKGFAETDAKNAFNSLIRFINYLDERVILNFNDRLIE